MILISDRIRSNMRLLELVGLRNLCKYSSTSASTQKLAWYYSKLTHRSLVKIRGDQSLQFLQGIVTNDTRYLSKSNENRPTALYSMMLNTQGRLLYDLILYVKSDHHDDVVYVECDRSITSDLIKQLTFYRLRKKLEFAQCDELAVYALFSEPPLVNDQMPTIGPNQPFLICNDPRVMKLGFRAILESNADAKHTFGAEEAEEDEYHALRYSLGIGEGCGDMPPGAAFPLEANGDYMNGISFHKGCYVGQELTARTHHTGVVRKRLMPLKFDRRHSNDEIRINAKILAENGANLGKFRRGARGYGLGLLYVQPALAAESLYIQRDSGESIPCVTEKPTWWETVDGEVRGFHSKSPAEPNESK